MTTNSIYQLLPKVMADVGSIGKDRENKHQRYRFRGIDDALNHVSPILTKHGVCVSAEFEDHKIERTVVKLDGDRERLDSNATLALKLTFYAPDGSHITNRLVGEGQDFGGDKATNKAMSAAMKYGLFFGLVIPVDAESVDDSDTDPKQESRPRGQAQRQQNGNGSKPAPKQNGQPRDYVVELRNLLSKQVGCETEADANAVVYWVTEHAYEGVKQAKATTEDTKAVLRALENAALTIPYNKMLEKAHQEIAADSVL